MNDQKIPSWKRAKAFVIAVRTRSGERICYPGIGLSSIELAESAYTIFGACGVSVRVVTVRRMVRV